MRCIRVMVTVVAVVLLSWGAAFGAEPAAPAEAAAKSGRPAHLRLLTGPNGGQWFFLGDPVAEALSKSVLPTSSRIGGGLSNIGNVGQKTSDLGFSLACFLGAASSGEEEYKNIKLDNVALMVNIYPQVLYFLLRKDVADKHGITSVETLLQKNIPLRFASLKPGTASEFILSMLLKYGYGKNFDALRNQGWTVSFNDYAETADNFVAGRLDCFAYTAGSTAPLIKAMEEHTEVLILPLEPKVLEMLANKFKTTTYVIQPGSYKSVTTPIATLGDYTCLVVRQDLPEDLVFAINKALWEEKDSIASVVKDFGALSPATALPAGLPTHPGSVRFWESLQKR